MEQFNTGLMPGYYSEALRIIHRNFIFFLLLFIPMLIPWKYPYVFLALILILRAGIYGGIADLIRGRTKKLSFFASLKYHGFNFIFLALILVLFFFSVVFLTEFGPFARQVFAGLMMVLAVYILPLCFLFHAILRPINAGLDFLVKNLRISLPLLTLTAILWGVQVMKLQVSTPLRIALEAVCIYLELIVFSMATFVLSRNAYILERPEEE